MNQSLFTTFIALTILVSSCSEQQPETKETSTQDNAVVKTPPENEAEEKTPEVAPEDALDPSMTQYLGNDANPFYIIPLDAFEKEKDAQDWVKERRAQGHKADYLWIPLFESLSGKELFATFYGPFEHDSAYNLVEELRAGVVPSAYGLGIDNEGNRLEFRGWDNSLYNGEKVDALDFETDRMLCITYDPVPDEEGSGDWGYFVSMVNEYCQEQSIKTGWYNYNSGEVEIQDGFSLSEDVDIDKLGIQQRGYILARGYRVTFTPHDMPDGVKSSINEFFGIEPEN